MTVYSSSTHQCSVIYVRRYNFTVNATCKRNIKVNRSAGVRHGCFINSSKKCTISRVDSKSLQMIECRHEKQGLDSLSWIEVQMSGPSSPSPGSQISAPCSQVLRGSHTCQNLILDPVQIHKSLFWKCAGCWIHSNEGQAPAREDLILTTCVGRWALPQLVLEACGWTSLSPVVLESSSVLLACAGTVRASQVCLFHPDIRDAPVSPVLRETPGRPT